MRPTSLLDNQSDQPEDHIMATSTDSNDAALNDLVLTVKVIESNYVTKEELAHLNGKVDGLAGRVDVLTDQVSVLTNQVGVLTDKVSSLSAKVDAMPSQLELMIKNQIDQAFKAHMEEMYRIFATKAELAAAINQQTWRMIGFGGLLLSAGYAFARFA
ncbi:hypothetical protein GTP45_02095 [Pseudoduganella sp. FT55W]|uniref:Uncharacterized protein n=1 Tax=Duganella rivi TaxID=2666083 RepID=A0A7X4GLC8_9BURK|nr:hypothetical protein [Duganella rivi]MYM65622.1 hypothetical protein [Duganella rivi]